MTRAHRNQNAKYACTYVTCEFITWPAGRHDYISGAHTVKPSIARITVEKLFGRYSYEISSDDMLKDGTVAEGRLILLYGENGSGKTTILSLVYHLLSSARKKGHRTFIARTEFQRFAILLTDGTSVEAVRPKGATKGTYIVKIGRKNRASQRFPMEIDSEGKVDPDDLEHNQLVVALSEIGVSPYYLSEDRTFLSDSLLEEDDEYANIRFDEMRKYRHHLLRSSRVNSLDNVEAASRTARQSKELLVAISRAERWLQLQAFRSTSAGMANANTVYADVLRHLLTASNPADAERGDNKTPVMERLNALAARSNEYAKFDLGTRFPARQFIELLRQAPSDRRGLLESALVPHIESSETQLDASKSIYELLTTFTTAINDLFVDKEISFSASSDGITISTVGADRQPIYPTSLSSGERQLLLLLTNTLIARENSGLFIIDEPEISLNVMWQRELLDVLLRCTSGTGVQFLVATHSIEMLSSHRPSMIRLAMNA